MKNPYLIAWATLLLALSLVHSTPASAEVVLTADMRPICQELPAQGPAHDECEAYYNTKQETMNKIRNDILLGMTSKPGEISLLNTIYADVQALDSSLETLVGKLGGILPENGWSSELLEAIQDEHDTMNAAANYWTQNGYYMSLLNSDAMVMMEAVEDFDSKAEILNEHAAILSEHWREAQNVLNGQYELEIVRDVYMDSRVIALRARALVVATSDMSESLSDVLAFFDYTDRYGSLEDSIMSALAKMDYNIWIDICDSEMRSRFTELSDMYKDAIQQLEERSKLFEEDSFFNEAGEPFVDLDLDKIDPEFQRMRDSLKAKVENNS